MTYDEKGSLQIAQNLEYQRRAWRRQRVEWVLLALLLVAALLGLFGAGLLSTVAAGDRNAPLWLEYDRFGHAQAESNRLLFHVAPAAASRAQVRLWLSRAYMERVRVHRVEPEPVAVEAAADRYTYVFAAPDLRAPTTVTFRFEPDEPGRLHGEAGLDGGPAFEFSQFIYP